MIENRKCKDYNIPIENRECKDYDVPVSTSGEDASSIKNRNCKDYNIPIETNGKDGASIDSRKCNDYNIPIENRECKDYDVPVSTSTPIESRKCKDYDIPRPDEKKASNSSKEKTTGTKPSDQHESSVLSREEITSRQIKTGVTRDEIEEEIQSFLQTPLRISNEIRSFFTICMFLSLLRCPPWCDLHPGFLMRGMYFFPVVGSIIGIAMAVTFDFFEETLGFPPILAATAATTAGWAFTLFFHEDGLCDSADGLGGGWQPKQILRIMSDSRVGTYGCATFCIYTIAKVQLIAALGESTWELYACKGAGPAIIVSQAVGRISSPYLLRLFDYIDDGDQPKSSFYAFLRSAKYLVTWPRAIIAIVIGFGIASVLVGPEVGAFVVPLVLLFAHFAGRYGNLRMGGVMGDFLGAVTCLSEILILSCIYFVQSNEESSLLEALKQIPHGLAFRRFISYIVARNVWTYFVDYFPNPSRILKEKEDAKEETPQPEDRPEEVDINDDSPKGMANKVLANPSSTFQERYNAVQSYLDVLAKPIGSLGTLELWAAKLGALQRSLSPDANNVACLIFAADHGAAAPIAQGGEECSAYPQVVTKSVMLGLHRQVAGASVLARVNNVDLRVVDVGIILGENQSPFDNSKAVVVSPLKLPNGTKNFCVEPAMSAEECERCMAIGRESLVQFVEETSSKIVVLGEIGIGNTTSSSALIAILTGKSTEEVCGGGAFATKEASQEVISKKIGIVDRALARHYGTNGSRQRNVQGADALAKLGGAEIASLVGAFLEASSRDIPVLVDGFIATAAALVAVSLSPNVCHVLFFASQSAEPGHRAAVEKIQEIALANSLPIDTKPILSMGLRMGEGTAAILAVPILRSSAKMLSDMATIQDILS